MNKTIADRELEACAWIAKIDGGAATSEDIAKLKAWILEHPENKRAFELFSADFVAVRDLLSTVGEAVHDLEDAAKRAGTFSGWIRAAKQNWSVMGVGGAVVASLVWGVVIMTAPRTELAPADHLNQTPIYYASNIGQFETIELEDGSSVMLNTDTEISVEYTPYERRVQLVQGEAVFDVAKDPNRPFRVHTNRAVVKAVGTIFSVKSVGGTVELMVEEGLVEFTSNTIAELTEHKEEANLSDSRLVSSGSYTKFESETETLIEKTDVAFVERRMAWRSGVLRFDSEPLSEVVSEYNRYITQKIIIDDPELLQLPVAGAFPIGKTRALIDALEQGFGVKIHYQDDDTIRLTK